MLFIMTTSDLLDKVSELLSRIVHALRDSEQLITIICNNKMQLYYV